MNLKQFLKDKLIYIICTLISVLSTGIILNALEIGTYATFFIIILILLSLLIPLAIEYSKRKAYYTDLLEKLDSLDKKSLLPEMISPDSFSDSKILYNVLKQTGKAMNEEISLYKSITLQYREYIEMWVHEIKTPIASTRLILENYTTPINDDISEDMDKIEGYVQQALFYARSSTVEKDYVIKRLNLKPVINTVIKRNAKLFIKNNIHLSMNVEDTDIYCDAKWIDFIINELILNAVKYLDKPEKSIKISATVNKNSVLLTIEDNGIGIAANDISRIYDKGFTGENGRKFVKSTGIGLYLCKKLCNKLDLGLSHSSVEGVGTTVNISFPVSSLTNM